MTQHNPHSLPGRCVSHAGGVAGVGEPVFEGGWA